MKQPRMLGVFPPPITVTSPEDLYLDLTFPNPPPERPYVFINMVRTVDGRSDIAGKAGSIGSDADRTVMRNLRSLSDAVMIGSGTLLAEKVSLDIPANLSKRRTDLGKSSQPQTIILSRNKELPLDNLFNAEPHNTFVLGKESLNNIGDVLKGLRLQQSIEYLLVEGGTSTNRSLQIADLVDEVFLTVAPTMVGGNFEDSSRKSNGSGLDLNRSVDNLELCSANILNSEIFLRYKANGNKNQSSFR